MAATGPKEAQVYVGALVILRRWTSASSRVLFSAGVAIRPRPKEGTSMSSINRKTVALLAASLVGTCMWVSVSRANSIEVSAVTTTQTAGVWDFAYTMSLTADNTLSATNPMGTSLFVFYDILGLTGARASFTAGTTASSDWSVVIENTSGVWSGGQSQIVSQGGTALEYDLASVPNVRFQYVGGDFASIGTNADIGTAHIYSTLGPSLVQGQYAARWIGNSAGETQINSQSVLIPGEAVVASSVPLPAAAWEGLSVMLGLGFAARARRLVRG